MRDSLSLGPTPSGEDCQQIPYTDRAPFQGGLYHGDKSRGDPEDGPLCKVCGVYGHSNDCPKALREGEEYDRQQTEKLAELIQEHGLVCVLDMLGEYCKKAETTIAGNSDSTNPHTNKWWAARVHIEHCSNLVEMLKL